MDAGASVAAFIGLVGLVAQSTTSLIQLIKDIRDTPGTHQANLKWLEQISCVLKDLQNTGSILQRTKLTIDLRTMEGYLRDCREAIDTLRAHVEKNLNGLKSTGFEKRKATLKAYFGSRNADRQIQNIQRAMEGLTLCYSSIIGQVDVQSYQSIQELTAQTNNLTLRVQDIRRAGESIAADMADLRSLADRTATINRQDTQQLQHASLGTLERLQTLQAGYEWMAAVQGVLPLEINNMVRNAIAKELKSAAHDQQRISNEEPRKQTLSLNASIQNVLPLERPGTLPTSRRLDNTSDCQSWEQFEEMEKDFLLPYQNRNDNYTAPPSNKQEQRPYLKSKILVSSWYYRAFFGYIPVVVSESHQVTAGREDVVIHVELKIFPWRWVSNRAFQARILYDGTRGLSSPTNIQLDFPRIIRCDSTDAGIWGLFRDRKSDFIIDNIRSGVYHPNDLGEYIIGPDGVAKEFDLIWTGPMSLLTLASLFGDTKVVQFLLQQGARVDQSGQITYGLPQDSLPKSDLQYALAPISWWITQTVDFGLFNPPARQVRLDTARFLMNAGSAIDSITLPILLMRAVEWDLETILSVVGNDDNFHWDVIQLDYNSFNWYTAFVLLWDRSNDLLAYRSRFERFVKLCKRLKIDLALTQPDGLTSLHWMIRQSSGEHISDVKHCLGVLVSNGVDPCAVCKGYLTPTLVAFFWGKLDLWFTVLRQLGISVEAVAAHALRLITESSVEDIISGVKREPAKYILSSFSSLSWYTGPRNWLLLNDTNQFGAALIEAFEHQGCYLNESADRGNMITYKASSSVDFKPSTVYDPERASRDIRRRTGARKNPQ